MNQLLQINLHFLQERIGDETVTNLLWCFGIIIATLLLKKPISILIAKLSARIANHFGDKEHSKMFLDLIVKPVEMLLQVCLYYIAVNQLNIFLRLTIFSRGEGKNLFEVRVSDLVDKLFLFLVILFMVFTLSRIVEFIFHILTKKAHNLNEREKEQLFPLIKEVFKIVLWIIGGFWILGSVFTVNIPALITGLGIGGVAIALAAKESVENVFAAFTILTDKPFQIGDNVRLNSMEGKVERIGFRSTRIRNAEGTVYIIPNQKLVNENLENLSQRASKKVTINFSLRNGIGKEQLEKVIADVTSILRSTSDIIGNKEVLTTNFNELSFQLSVSYFLPVPLKQGMNENVIKQEISVKVYAIIAPFTLLEK